ncbi:hypothetical protein HPB50_024526 [Hyalomma asiaticum]|uniref:Uncharacterized protein n=1 Tax=Hyalomma asiaticum TaxID=266040 RepID=A0ACB7SKL4_HYAAI|nr:hypothetical protein HPB50_024526 [Hyalomma asiaticum]
MKLLKYCFIGRNRFSFSRYCPILQAHKSHTTSAAAPYPITPMAAAAEKDRAATDAGPLADNATQNRFLHSHQLRRASSLEGIHVYRLHARTTAISLIIHTYKKKKQVRRVTQVFASEAATRSLLRGRPA